MICSKCGEEYARVQSDWFLKQHPETAKWCPKCVIQWIIAAIKPKAPSTYYEPPTGWKR